MIRYTYDGTFDGFLSVVFYIYEKKLPPSSIIPDGEYQTDFFSETVFVPTDISKAMRVENSLTSKIGNIGFGQIISAFSCGFEPENKDLKIFDFIRLVLRVGGDACKMYHLHTVSDFYSLVLKTDKEAQHMQGFLRFKSLSNGILAAEYSPDNDITHFLTPYFSQRNSENKFIIRDTIREVYGLYNGSEWTVVPGTPQLASVFEDLVYSEKELVFRDLWQQYYDTVSIASRRNERQRTQFMPRRYWKYLTEIVI